MFAGTTTVMPPLGHLTAPATWQCVDLISDLHLQAAETATFEAWRHFMRTTEAQAVLILGDLFEVWVGDDAVASDPFLQACAEILRQTAERITVGFMPGNRDFLLGHNFLSSCGVQALNDPTVLEWGDLRLLLSHGDALCVADVDYQRFRLQVRSADWQRAFLAQPLQERLRLARAMRKQSESQKLSDAVYADADTPTSLAWLSAANSRHLIHGHTHKPADHRLLETPHALRQVLSDWSLDHTPLRAQALRLRSNGQTERLDIGPKAPSLSPVT
jgi:UDP-2,3-diacylglucosamine hydrolase